MAKVAGWIHEHGGNVLHADQHLDRQENIFFQRVEWCPAESRDLRSESDAFSLFANKKLGMKVHIALSEDRPRIAIMVSKADHCFHDLVLRVRSGEWNANIAGILSNHESLRSASEGYGLDYLYLPVSKETKIRDSSNLIVNESSVELVILARYMQVLSSSFLASWVSGDQYSPFLFTFFRRSQALSSGIPAWGKTDRCHCPLCYGGFG